MKGGATASEGGDGRVELNFDLSNFVLHRLATGELELSVLSNQSAAYFFIRFVLDRQEL